MKFSTAILKGYERVGGRQTEAVFFRDRYGHTTFDRPAVHSACVLGAAILGASNDVDYIDQADTWRSAFLDAWGDDPAHLNNQGMPWQDLYGMAKAAGL